jgi:hypothetical protein
MRLVASGFATFRTQRDVLASVSRRPGGLGESGVSDLAHMIDDPLAN